MDNAAIERLASEGQQTYIGDLIRDRLGQPATMGEITLPDKPECMAAVPDDMKVDQWIAILTFAMAREALQWLVTLPAPEKPAVQGAGEEGTITPQQRSKCWAILKTLGNNTYRAWLLKKDDPDIPHLRWADTDTSVWDWLSELSFEEAHEVIQHLEAVQNIIR